MNMKKFLCLMLALAMCCAAAYAETDIQAELDAANARIAELEAQVELYKPFYDAQIVAEFDGGVIFLDDALTEYAAIEGMYAQYGISLADYGLEEQFKQEAVTSLVTAGVLNQKAAELGLSELDEETMAGITEQAEANYETYVSSVVVYFTAEDTTEEQAREEAIAYLDSIGNTKEAMLESMIASYVDELLYNHVVEGVAVTEEDVKAAYEALVAEQQTSFTSDSSYNTARNNGETIVWNPEGYRAVKHVLVKFTDEQTTRYNELTSTLTTLEAELTAVQNPSEEADEETEARTAEEINADIAAVQADIDALYAELMPIAQEVIDKFNAGTPFAELIAVYNEDPGMTSEPTATNGYAVHADSVVWDPAFTAGAMSIEAVGGISEPVFGMYGIHIISYDADITAGAVDFEAVRDVLEADALETKLSETYNAAVSAWVEEAAPVYHFENLR